ncbi:Abi-like protein [Propionibacterium cyclohexanicum]|uniref:Abi-like protein n=1 Tax=Propionibacterium cyclohexanicum TaxID=64702 RepID=A0A1H9TVB7_9ACTN|nr:Abi-like protein [Propionibacterium cyclohexanicum]
MAHLTQKGLDADLCGQLNKGPNHEGTRYESWRREYDKLQAKAKGEDYVRHFCLKYNSQVPVWAAGEFMTIGCAIALYRMML